MSIKNLYKKTLLFEEMVALAGFIILFATVLIQIFFRLKPVAANIDYAPVWTEELSRWLFVYVVFFQSSLCIHNKEHIGIDIFVEKMPRQVARIVKALVFLLMAFCCVVFIYYGIRNTVFASRQRPLTLPFHNGVLYSVVPIGFTLMLIRLVFAFLVDMRADMNTSKG